MASHWPQSKKGKKKAESWCFGLFALGASGEGGRSHPLCPRVHFTHLCSYQGFLQGGGHSSYMWESTRSLPDGGIRTPPRRAKSLLLGRGRKSWLALRGNAAGFIWSPQDFPVSQSGPGADPVSRATDLCCHVQRWGDFYSCSLAGFYLFSCLL